VTSAADIWTYGLVLWEMIALSTPHCENFDENESSEESVTLGDITNNQLDESNVSKDDSITSLEDVMPHRFSKYGK